MRSHPKYNTTKIINKTRHCGKVWLSYATEIETYISYRTNGSEIEPARSTETEKSVPRAIRNIYLASRLSQSGVNIENIFDITFTTMMKLL